MNRALNHRQQGAATLVIAVVLLISITLVTLFTAKVVLEDTRTQANNYRTAQAFSAANYGLDFAIHYFDRGGFDQLDETVDPAIEGTDDVVDSIVTDSLTLQNASGDQITTAQVQFITDAARCGGTSSWQNGLVLATGFSDDRSATRTMGQCVGPINILNGEGPEIPLISRTRIDTTGNANIINRYTNTNIWSADEVYITGASFATYIKDPAATMTTKEDYLDTDEGINTQLVSNRNLGNGADIISGDPSLDLGAGFFGNFFAVEQRAALQEVAATSEHSFGANQINEADGESGLFYFDGDQSLQSDTVIGSVDSPAIVVVDGDLSMAGGATIYGLVYVAGEMNISGTPSVVGSAIVENEGGAPTDSGYTGSGTLNLVYWQNFLDGDSQPIAGLTSVIEGSWRDW